MKTMAVLMAAGVILASCSDDDRKYDGDVCFTGSQETVVAIGKTGGSPSIGSPSTVVCFDAPSSWQISAKDATDTSKAADWVSFKQTNGGEGSHRIGVYATDNAGADRAAFIEVASAGKTIEFLLVQKGTATKNPNDDAIDPKKVVAKVEYFEKGKEKPDHTVTFNYTDGGMVITDASVVFNTTSTYTYTYTNDVKVSIAERKESYAILNSRAFKGYRGLTATTPNSSTLVNFTYDGDYIKEISSFDFKFIWEGQNLSGVSVPMNYDEYTYTTLLNDANLDLNCLIASTAGASITPLQIINLEGKRSANLISSCNDVTYTYEEDENGLTVTDSDITIIKISYK